MISKAIAGSVCSWRSSSVRISCSMLMLMIVLQLFNPAPTHAQSSVVATSKATVAAAPGNPVPNSMTAAQLATESTLAQPASQWFGQEEELSVGEAIRRIGVSTFYDLNLDGVMDRETTITMKTGVSLGAALQKALLSVDTSFLIEDDGSILLISLDDEWELGYLRRVTYDVTSIAGSMSQLRNLSNVLQNSIHPDSWEMNGGGSSTISIYQHNRRNLITILQCYAAHQEIRSHLAAVSKLGGSSVSVTPTRRIAGVEFQSTDGRSRVVQVPKQQTTSAQRARRGFARPNSGSSGGFGGGGYRGGVF